MPHLPDDQTPRHSFLPPKSGGISWAIEKSPFKGVGVFSTMQSDPKVRDGLVLDYYLEQTHEHKWVKADTREPVYQIETFSERLEYEGRLAEDNPTTPYGIVTNLDRASFPDGWPLNMTMFLECFWNADGGIPGKGRSIPNMLWEASQLLGKYWGYVPIVIVPGLYDGTSEGGVRLTMEAYMVDLLNALTMPQVIGWCPFQDGSLEPIDREYLGEGK